MLTNRAKYKEEAHIGEELFQDETYELERQCMTVEGTVKRKILSLPEALQAYEVTKEQFEDYLARNIREGLLTSLYIKNDSVDNNMYLHVVSKIFHPVAGKHHKKKIAKIEKDIRQLSDQIQSEESLVD